MGLRFSKAATTLQPKPPAVRRGVRMAGPRLAHLATRIFNTPLCIHPQKMHAILAALGPHLGLQNIPVAMDDMDWQDDDNQDQQMQPADNYMNGVCVIPVQGTLVKRSSGMDAASGMTSYSDIQADIEAALGDEQCSGLVLDFDSPGGEVSGMFELADYIASMRGSKPIIGIANDSAFSAAYCLAAACDRTLVTTLGGAGSIGCFMLHCDRSGSDEQRGLDYTYVFSGDRKVDGNEHEPLNDTAKSEIQARVDAVRAMFVQSVARNRGVDAQAIFDTQAGCFYGAAAVPMLCDETGLLGDAIEMAVSRAKGKRGIVMPGKPAIVHPDKPLLALQGFNVDLSAPSKDGIYSMRQFSSPCALAGTETKRVTGVLAPYNSLSSDLGGFKEIYSPGCFAASLRDGSEDPRVLFNHDIGAVLGRMSNGTARFWEEADGLHYEADLPDTQAGRDVRTLVERGDIRESSAAFYITKQHPEQRGGWKVRVIEEARLVEGGPHSFAAYDRSTANVSRETALESSVGPESELSTLEAELELLALM